MPLYISYFLICNQQKRQAPYVGIKIICGFVFDCVF
ncbi:unnamed protein product [Tenebrio molitor]|nr:unnamed protein product [Tenebrio molitor]